MWNYVKATALMTSSALSLLFSNPCHAINITINNPKIGETLDTTIIDPDTGKERTFSVSVTSGSFDGLGLDNTPWFGNEALTDAVVEGFGLQLGVIGYSGSFLPPDSFVRTLWGPVFAFSIHDDGRTVTSKQYKETVATGIFSAHTSSSSSPSYINVRKENYYSNYVTGVEVQPVPEPLTILGSVIAAGMGYAVRRCKSAQQSAAQIS